MQFRFYLVERLRSLYQSRRGLAAAILVLLDGCAKSPATVENNHLEVSIEWVRPEDYLDVRLSGRSREDSLAVIQETFRQVLQRETKRLPEGSQLNIRFTAVDLAGWIPPGRLDDVRVVSESHPARLEFDYSFKTKNNGSPQEQTGHESLTSFGDLRASDSTRNQALGIESKLLRDWIRTLVRKIS